MGTTVYIIKNIMNRSILFSCYSCSKSVEFNESFRYLIGGVIVSELASCAVDRRFEAKQAILRRNSKNWLARNRDVSVWSDMSILGLLFQ